MLRPSPHTKDGRSGFALLITITLLAFLVLLLVSLAALTRVETQVASNNQQLSQARQHALMGLNVALGRLQALAGPDRRITAAADIVPGVHDDKRRWTGVWNTTGAAPVPDWLVSSATPAAATGTAPVADALPASGTVALVGSYTVDTSVAGNAVTVETQIIASDGIPGLAGPQTVGSFAYWVGDEGVKARVDLVDPGAAETATEADEIHSFINAQRFGIEGVDANAPGTPLSAYPANDDDILPKVVDLKQLSLANPANPAPLSAAVKNRFHDLTTSSGSVLADVVNGGLKKDLTAWIADPAAPSNPVSTSAADDYIAPGDPADTGKYGLPKWELLRSYATTRAGTSALAPRPQTSSQQGISPVITYARMGYNLTKPDAASGNYRINIMPVVALWNPYNVPLQASTDDSNSYEFCIKYQPAVFLGTGGVVVHDGARLMLYIYPGPPPGSPEGTPSDPPSRGDTFYLGTIQMRSVSAGPLGPSGTFASYAVGSTPAISTSSGPEPVFWRFRVKLSKDLGPGESRLFTISDASDESQYVAGQSELSDDVFGINNGVYLPSSTPLTATQTRPAASFFWNTEPVFGGSVYSIRPHYALTEVRLTKPVSSGETNLATIDAFLSDPANTYQAIVGNAFAWETETNPGMTPAEILPPNNNGRVIAYQRIELLMSSNYDRFVSGTGSPGTPRWLAQFNPQAAVSLRKPHVPTSPNTPAAAGVITPSYEAQGYIKREAVDATNYPYILLPEADGTNVTAGTQVTTPGTPQNVVLREFQPVAVPLFSLGQLQHANASLLNLNPAYPIGNSLANLHVPRTATQSDALPQDAFNTYHANNTYPGFPDSGTFRHIYDLSYLLNQSLWDRCFFSTVPASLTATQARDSDYRLPNARHRFYWPGNIDDDDAVTNLKTTDSAAAHLLVNGGFNVNSTSEQAWRALLHSHNGIATDPDDAAKKHPYSRLAVPVAPDDPNTPWEGYRILSDAQINALAKAIVVEVRKRGPFLSLADFVNRRLVADETGLKGPLQAAIDATAAGTAPVNEGSPFDFDDMPMAHYPPDIATDTEQQIIYKGDADTTLPSSTATASRAAFAPGYLTQADLLAALGPSLVARSDTFRIRAYGDVLNPVTGSATPEARAWCEAIVQRQPDYVEPAVNPASLPAAGSASETFGRRFKVISFRWLSSHDI